MFENKSDLAESKVVKPFYENPWRNEIDKLYEDPRHKTNTDSQLQNVPAIAEAQRLVDFFNKQDSQSILAAYESMTAEDKQKFELYTDKSGHLQMRLTEEFKREAQEAYRTGQFVDALTKHDLEALNKLLPLNLFDRERLIKAMEDSGWKVEEEFSFDPPSQKATFIPPDGKKPISWISQLLPHIGPPGSMQGAHEQFVEV